MIATAKLHEALTVLEKLFPGQGIMLTIFDEQGGETIANRPDEITAAMIAGLYINRVQRPFSNESLQ